MLASQPESMDQQQGSAAPTAAAAASAAVVVIDVPPLPQADKPATAGVGAGMGVGVGVGVGMGGPTLYPTTEWFQPIAAPTPDALDRVLWRGFDAPPGSYRPTVHRVATTVSASAGSIQRVMQMVHGRARVHTMDQRDAVMDRSAGGRIGSGLGGILEVDDKMVHLLRRLHLSVPGCGTGDKGRQRGGGGGGAGVGVIGGDTRLDGGQMPNQRVGVHANAMTGGMSQTGPTHTAATTRCSTGRPTRSGLSSAVVNGPGTPARNWSRVTSGMGRSGMSSRAGTSVGATHGWRTSAGVGRSAGRRTRTPGTLRIPGGMSDDEGEGEGDDEGEDRRDVVVIRGNFDRRLVENHGGRGEIRVLPKSAGLGLGDPSHPAKRVAFNVPGDEQESAPSIDEEADGLARLSTSSDERAPLFMEGVPASRMTSRGAIATILPERRSASKVRLWPQCHTATLPVFPHTLMRSQPTHLKPQLECRRRRHPSHSHPSK
ncbi:hypothetical protein BC831DRAFT_473494 [Entophlyctis helioformis]|nr:hypothetical protein BC831DRAFT_473494 [Entophlyctis helioformis]